MLFVDQPVNKYRDLYTAQRLITVITREPILININPLKPIGFSTYHQV